MVNRPNEIRELPSPVPVTPVRSTTASRDELAAIVARATEAAEAARLAEAAAAAEAEAAAEKKRLAKQRRKERAERKEKDREKKEKRRAEKASASSSKPVDKDKVLVKLVGEVVVKYMSHYKDQMEHETFKKHAKEVSYYTSSYNS